MKSTAPLVENPYDALPLQVWTARPDGTLDSVNSTVASFFGVDRQRVLDEGWKDLCHPLDLIMVSQRWQRSLSTGEPYEVEFRLLRGIDQQFRWHLGRAEAMRCTLGNIIGWVGYNADIDSVKRAEEVTNSLLVQLRIEQSRVSGD